jgi:general secretion pathway protein D
VADETVSGTATYHFHDTDLDAALQGFLSAYGLHARTENSITYVSRIAVDYRAADGTVSFVADRVTLESAFRALSSAIGRTILYDSLPRDPVSLNATALRPDALLSMAVARYPELRVEDRGDYLYVRRIDPAQPVRAKPSADAIVRDGDRYSIATDTIAFSDALAALFRVAGKEYTVFAQTDPLLQRMRFADKSLDELLRLILDQAGADFAVRNDVYAIFEVQRRDILKRFYVTEYVPLTHVSVKEIPNLLPPTIAGGALYRFDQASNAVIVTGSQEEAAPLVAFLRDLDRADTGKSFQRFELEHIGVQEAMQLLPERFRNLGPIALPAQNAMVLLTTPEGRTELEGFLDVVDGKRSASPVTLRYIRAEDLLERLPPAARREEIVLTGRPGVVFFTGSDARRESFLRDLEIIDQPAPQIRYQILVIQEQENSGLSTSADYSTSVVTPEAYTAIVGALGQLLSLNLDIIATFGYQFAVRLAAELATSRAHVLADTTLNALSGQEVRFQNTDTFRYRETEIDPDTGKPKTTGVTREITSGLIISINGWSSGDGMITMKVAATVSSRGADVSTSTGNPPPTSERVVQTNVRTRSGDPLVIGGLTQQKLEVRVKKTPLLGDIPLLGRLFQSREETTENTELAVYIVPYLEGPVEAAADPDRFVDETYARLLGPEAALP